MSRLPLEGIRIIDLASVWAGPYAGMILADMGAQVIKVESTRYWPIGTRGPMARPPKEFVNNMVPWAGGYPNREPGPRAWNQVPFFNHVGRNKCGMTVDITQPEGLDILFRLVRVSDVVIQNQIPIVQEKLGLTYESFKKVKPDIIVACISGYGLSGTYKNYRNMAVEIESYAGHTLLRGYTELDPDTTTEAMPSDAAAGANAAFAILTALNYRDRSGNGQLIDLSIAENMICFLGEVFMDYYMNGRVQKTQGNRESYFAPCGCYRCKGDDRWINIVVTSDGEWDGFRRVLGDSCWAGEERFRNILERWKHRDELDILVEQWTSQYDNYELMLVLQKEGVPSGIVMDQRDTYNDPHLRERGFFEQVFHVDCGTHLYPGMLFKMSKSPLHIRTPAVRLGEHNEYVYKNILGVSQEEYKKLKEAGHIGMDFAPEIP